MQRFKRILAYVDIGRNSSAMLQQAARLASANGARLTVVSCCSRPPCCARVLIPSDASSISVRATREKHDLSMLPVERRHFLRHRMFSSMTLHLLRKCPCPVWVFTLSARKPFRRILAAVDAFAIAEAEISVNKKILELATSFLHFRKGDPEVAIPAFAARHKTDLLVMGTVARTGMPGFFIGNTAEQILQKVTCSLLAVKPDGFVSPIELA